MVTDYSLFPPVYDRLLQLSADHTVEPMLATSHELSDDKRSLTLELRDDVVFHDGTQFDANVVKANLDYVKSLTSSPSSARLALVDEVVVVDDYTVRLDLNADGTMLPLTLAYFVGVSAMVSPDALEDPEELATTPAGSGPYVWASQTQDRVVFEKADSYWDDEFLGRAPQRIEMVMIPDDNARAAALQAGQIDAMVVLNPLANENSIVDGDEILSYASDSSMRNVRTLVNLDSSALADPRVRKALSLAIDRDAIASSVLQETCVPTGQPFPPDTPGHDPDVGVPEFDPDAARDLLDEAGVDSLDLDLMIVAGTLFQNLATALQAQWEDIGVDVELHTVEGAQSGVEWSEGRYDLFATSMSGLPDPGLLTNEYFTGPPLMPGGSDPRVVEMARAAFTLEPGSDERDRAYREITAYMADNPTSIEICNHPPQAFYHSYVGGIDQQVTGSLTTVFDTRPLVVYRDR